MATLSTTNLNWLADQWENAYASAQLSGIVGDLAHKARGGYHISRQDQPKTNYSVVRADDKLGPSDRASAIDMTMSKADIIKCHTRLRGFWKNRSTDSRMKYINAWNGWDGIGDAGRYDVITGKISTATSDHKWHIHLEIRRRYVNDRKAMEAILSMLKGESHSAYIARTTPVPIKPAPVPVTTPTTSGEIVTEAQLIAALNKWLTTDQGKKTLNSALAWTDGVWPTPRNFIGPDGEPIWETNPQLTWADFQIRTAMAVQGIMNIVMTIEARLANLEDSLGDPDPEPEEPAGNEEPPVTTT